MLGKVCVVTGATSGIGQEMAASLVRSGARVAIVGRSERKLEATRAAVGGGVDLFRADLSILAEVRRLADELHAAYDRIDVLMNNAGVLNLTAAVTSEGFDAMVATNYLAPFVLTNCVLDLLQAAAPSRVVNTASEAHRFNTRVDLDHVAQPGTYAGVSWFRPYGNSKLLDMLFSHELARRLEGTGVTANCFCPGAVNTGLVGENRFYAALVALIARTPLIQRPAEGARMGVRLATDPELEHVSGRFFTSTPGARLLPVVSARKDADVQRRLWELTARLTGM